LENASKSLGPIVNKNNYNYEFTKDHVFIEKIEKLWMVVHQKPYMLASRLISLGMAKGLACERMGKAMNWAMYAKWMNSEQQHHKARMSLEQVDVISFDEKAYEGHIWNRCMAK